MFKLASFLLLVFVIHAPMPAFAQLGEVPMPKIAPQKETGPTLEETQQWLKEKVAEFGKYEFTVKYSSSEIYTTKVDQLLSFSGCEFDYKKNENGHLGEYIVFSLADLDPNLIKIGTGDMKFGQEKISWVDIFSDGKSRMGSLLVMDFYIEVTDVAVADRIKKAMQHAITICQERTLREAPTQPASKEAF